MPLLPAGSRRLRSPAPCLPRSLTGPPGQIKKEEKLWPENFTNILNSLLDGYDNRLRPGFGGTVAARWRRRAGGRWAGAGGAALSARTDPLLTENVGVCPRSVLRGPSPPERAGSEAAPGPKARGVLRIPAAGAPLGRSRAQPPLCCSAHTPGSGCCCCAGGKISTEAGVRWLGGDEGTYLTPRFFSFLPGFDP